MEIKRRALGRSPGFARSPAAAAPKVASSARPVAADTFERGGGAGGFGFLPKVVLPPVRTAVLAGRVLGKSSRGTPAPAPTNDLERIKAARQAAADRSPAASRELLIEGTDGADSIAVKKDGGQLVVDVNGEETRYAAADYDQVTVRGRGGNDTIAIDDSVTHASVLIGGEGDDTIRGGAGKNVIDGGAGDDRLTGGDAADHIEGGDGNDDIDGNGGDDALLGHDSTGAVYDRDDDSIDGGAGDDEIYGGFGANDLAGEDGHDYLEGGLGNDRISGGAGVDMVYGLDGDDTIDGGSSRDYVDGGEGADTIAGGAGDDTLIGGRGADTIAGGAGDDTLAGGEGADTYDGGAGADRVIYQDQTGEVDAVAADAHDTTTRLDTTGDEPGAKSIFVDPGTDPQFQAKVRSDLDALRSIPEGRALLVELDGTGKKLGISERSYGAGSKIKPRDGGDDTLGRKKVADDGSLSNGTPVDESVVYINRAQRKNAATGGDGRFAPGSVVLGHELIHGLHFAKGEVYDESLETDGVKSEELRTTGLAYDHDGDPTTAKTVDQQFTENWLRAGLGWPGRRKY